MNGTQLLTGEPLALDLVNTLAMGPTGEVDLLASAEAFRPWLEVQADRIPVQPTADAGIDPAALPGLRALRAHVADALDRARSGRPPLPAGLAALVDAQRAATAYRDLAWDGGAVVATRRYTGTPAASLLAALADAAVDLLGDPSALARVRRCEGPDCRLLFLAVNPRRRWCSPALCGNRVRVARYYQRHRTEPGAD